MAKLKTDNSTRSNSGPMNQPEATNAAGEHPDVVAATERLHAWLRGHGIDDPDDPRFVLSRPDVVGQPEYKRLEREADEAFARIRRGLMESQP